MELINIHGLKEILKFSRLKLLLPALVSPSCSAVNKQLLLLPHPQCPALSQEMQNMEFLTPPACFGKTRVCHLLARQSLRPNHC